jgi:hypothetical protein
MTLQVFPSPAKYDVFMKEQKMQREFKRNRLQQRGGKGQFHRNNNLSAYGPTDGRGASPVQPPQKKDIKKCPHGRTEGYCQECKGETPVAKEIASAAPAKVIKTCPHGRTEGYCQECKGEVIK